MNYKKNFIYFFIQFFLLVTYSSISVNKITTTYSKNIERQEKHMKSIFKILDNLNEGNKPDQKEIFSKSNKSHSLLKAIIYKSKFYLLNNSIYNKSKLFFSTIEKELNLNLVTLPAFHKFPVKKMFLTNRKTTANDIYNGKFFYVYFSELFTRPNSLSYGLFSHKVSNLLAMHLNKNIKFKPNKIDFEAEDSEKKPILAAISFSHDVQTLNYTGPPVFYDISITKHGIYSFIISTMDLYIARFENKKWIYEYKIPVKFNDPFYAVVFKNSKYVVTSNYKVYKVNENNLDLIDEISCKNKYCIIDKTNERLFFAPLISKKNKQNSNKFQIIEDNKLKEFSPDELIVQAIGDVDWNTK